jgi:hypothetical protein
MGKVALGRGVSLGRGSTERASGWLLHLGLWLGELRCLEVLQGVTGQGAAR